MNKKIKYHLNSIILLCMWSFWIALFCEQKYSLSFNRHLGDFIVTGVYLFFGLFMFVSWPIALLQLIYGSFRFLKQDKDIGKNVILGAITTLITYSIIICFIFLGVDVKFWP
jgi:hypothetical protein